ncbi:MAG: DUF6036 family nucleotidyltransferase [Bacteriovoracaceae bacterium]
MNISDVINEFDVFLSKKNISFEAVIIGGAALNLMNITSRVTRDVDFLDPSIPENIKKASIEFKNHIKNKLSLDHDWINNGPESLKNDLPKGWRDRCVEVFNGKCLILFTLGRLDLLKTKLYAYCDRDTDFDDCIKLNPTLEEINQCLPWVLEGDASELWESRVNESILRLKVELGLTDE